MEEFRPYIRQYFVKSDIDGKPISRMFRSIVYQRAKGEAETVVGPENSCRLWKIVMMEPAGGGELFDRPQLR